MSKLMFDNGEYAKISSLFGAPFWVWDIGRSFLGVKGLRELPVICSG